MFNGSEYELDLLGIKFAGAEAADEIKCVGSCEEEMTAKVITKSCRGVVVKKVVKGTGEGTLKITAHIPYAIYEKFYGMTLDSLVTGAKAYGRNSVHKGFCLTAHVTDEDGAEKYKAYPNCVVATGVVREIKNGAEEVAQLELEVSVMPDEHGNGLYEVIAGTDTANLTKDWIKSFDASKLQNVQTA